MAPSGTRRAGFVALLAAAALAVSVPAASGGAPAGATARCRDGTYSFSRHHSGTCSHHGGVAAWRDGSVSPPGGRAPTPAAVSVGRTVPLAPRTRTSGCRLGPRPDRACSPGAYSSGLTKRVICSPSFRTSSVRHVTEAERHAVEAEYGLPVRAYGSALEIDHIVSLELGGSNDVANLFPERARPAPGYRVKDRLENRLHALVCSGRMSLRAARRGIAVDWERLYRKVFGTAPGV